MPYLYSQVDRSNLDWFDKDVSRASLIRLEILGGPLRGLTDTKLHFRYPLTVISGKNGTGKSTILGCAACAFHNSPAGFKTLKRNIPYYTFSDFFLQAAEEEPLAFVYVRYEILHNRWRKTKDSPEGVGLGWQTRRKELGRWNNYASRVPRTVVFCGIDRVVPHSEKSVSKSYRKVFQRTQATGYEPKVAETVGRILGRSYDEFYYKQFYKHRLPLVRLKQHTYSGFNMGAGENTLFEIFSIIYACEESLLLVIDEIELGLHEEAQRRLIDELKQLCLERHIQVICTTHSPRIIAAVPPEGRLHLERFGKSVRVIPAISSQYAAGLMSGIKDAELNVYCEDEFARETITLALSNELRTRINVIDVGSAAAVTRLLVATFRDKTAKACCAILDGDQVGRKAEHHHTFTHEIERAQDRQIAKDWIDNRLGFLPGGIRPEVWVISQVAGKVSDRLAADLGASKEEVESHLEQANVAEPHSEFHVLSTKLNLSVVTIRSRLIRAALSRNPADMARIAQFIRGFLSS